MRHLPLLLSLAFFAACTTDKVLEEVEDISGSKDPMRFTVTKEGLDPASRASNPLNTGFMVSCYKLYGQTTQETVMPNYEVRHHTSGTAWDGTVAAYWTYDDVEGQFLKYWDYAAFPYRFNAIAPYPTNTDGYILGDVSLKINAPYKAQTCHNGLVTPSDNEAEPHLLSQVQRNVDGTDHDIIGTPSEINNGSTSKNRDVWMPFHHINSKIRFGVYHTTQWMTYNKTYIKNLVINATGGTANGTYLSAPTTGFATAATGYEASGTGSWRIKNGTSGFTGLTTFPATATNTYEVFRFDGGESVEGNDLTERQTRKTAYFLQCPEGIMQIPQEHVEMTVSFDLYTPGASPGEDGDLYMSFQDVPVRLVLEDDTDSYQNYFDWLSGFIHTYYLVIGEIDNKLTITFTATLTPWEDVTGQLETDLEK